MFIFLFLISSVTLLPFPTQALAEEDYDWQFSVPVKLSKLDPQVMTVLISARILNSNGANPAPNVLVINATSIEVPPDGNVDETVVINVVAPPNIDLSTVAKYRIELTLSLDPIESPGGWHGPNTSGEYWTKSKPGTVLVAVIEKDIPEVMITEEQAQWAMQKVKLNEAQAKIAQQFNQ